MYHLENFFTKKMFGSLIALNKYWVQLKLNKDVQYISNISNSYSF